MSGSFQHFLDEVCSYISWKEARMDVRRELEAHLEDRAECYKQEGKSSEEAVSLAVRDMGCGEEIGLALDRQHRPQTDWKLIGLTGVLTAFGAVLMVCSRLNGFAQGASTVNYIISLLLGFSASVALVRFQYRHLLHHSMKLYVGMLVLLFCSPIFSTYINGSPVFISVGLSTPIPVMIWLFLIPMSGILYQYRGGGWFEIFKWLGLCALVFVAGARLPALAPSVLFLACAAVLLFTAIWKGEFRGKRSHYIAGLMSMGAILIVPALLLMSPYYGERMLHFIWGDRIAWNYPSYVANELRQSAPLFGGASGMGDGGVLVDGNGVFGLTGIISSIGWAAGIALLAVVVLFLVKLIFTVLKVKDGYGKYLAIACSSALVMKFIFNILINFGVIAFTSVNMPLVSRGGAEFIQDMIFIGLILSVWSRNRLSLASEEGRQSGDRDADSAGKFCSFSNGKLTLDFNFFKITGGIGKKWNGEKLAETRWK